MIPPLLPSSNSNNEPVEPHRTPASSSSQHPQTPPSPSRSSSSSAKSISGGAMEAQLRSASSGNSGSTNKRRRSQPDPGTNSPAIAASESSANLNPVSQSTGQTHQVTVPRNGPLAQHQSPPHPAGPPGAQLGEGPFGEPPDIPPFLRPEGAKTGSAAAYGASSGTRVVGTQANDGRHSLPSPISFSTHADRVAEASSFSSVIGTDLFAGIDTFLTFKAALADRKNRKAAEEFVNDPANDTAYKERKKVLDEYKAAENDPNAATPQLKLSAKDVRFVDDFEKLQVLTLGNKSLKKMARFRDLAVQPTSAMYNTGVSIARMATKVPGMVGVGTSIPGLISGPINAIVGGVETKDARKNRKDAEDVLERTKQIGSGEEKMEALIQKQFTQLANAKIDKSKKERFHGVSRAINGTTGTITSSLGVASVATGVATMGIGAAIAGSVVAGGFAATYTSKLINAKRMEKSDIRERDIAGAFIDQEKGGADIDANSEEAFRAVKNAFSQMQDGTETSIQVPSRKWHGEQKTAKDGSTPMSDKPITGTDINNNRYISEYLAAGHIAKFLGENPNPHLTSQSVNGSAPENEAEVKLGGQYIEDLKKVVPDAEVDELISKARATRSFKESMEILTNGLHDLSNI